MTALAVQSPIAFSLRSLTGSALNMKRFVDGNKWIQNQELSNVEEVQSSIEFFSWRKQSSFTARYFSRNHNAISRHHSQNEDIAPQLLNASSSSTNFTTDNSVQLPINVNNQPEKIDSHLSQKSVTITRRSSKPSRHESVQIATSQIRQRQRDRYRNYHHRLNKNQLYSLIVSSNDVQCYETNCQPSVFNASYRCRTIFSENDLDVIKKSSLINDQHIKQNISYISLTNLSNLIDHEPNVSRRDSYSQSTSNILMPKPSLFLADIFNKMTHEQRAKSIAQLVKYHENLSKSNIATDKVQRTTSLPNLNDKPTKAHSAISLLSERTIANIIQIETRTSSKVSTEQKHLDEGMNLEHNDLEILSDARPIDSNEEKTLAFIDQKIHISELLDEPTISSPIKLVSLPSLDTRRERKLSEENTPPMQTDGSSATSSTISLPIPHSSMTQPASIFTKPSNTNTGSGKTKISRSNHLLDLDLNEQSSATHIKPIKISTIDQIKTQSSNLSKPIASSSNSIINSAPIQKLPSGNETKSETKFETDKDLSSKQTIQKLYSKNNTNQPLKVSSSYSKKIDQTSQSSNDENEIENSLNDVTDHLSQQDIIISNTNLDKPFDIPSKESNTTKQILPLLTNIDETHQHSKSSHSHRKNSPLLITSPPISLIPTKPELTSLSPIDDGDTLMITRTATASTNLTTTNEDDDDEQSKLINEQLKRSSLGLARDSLELLRNTSPHPVNINEQLTPHTNIDSTPHQRKSVLKSRIDSSDNLPTPELISYVAIDEVKGDEGLMEKQMRRHSLTVGGGTIISCTSPKPKRDSLILLQERYSGSMTPHSGYYHLSSSDSRHVEFIREPGDTITPVLHIGRGTKSKYPSSKFMSPSSSSDHFPSHTFDSSEQTKSEMSVIDIQPRSETETHPRRPPLDNASRHRTTSFDNTDDIEEEKVCFNKRDYEEIVRLIMTPSSKEKKNYPMKSTCESHVELCVNNRLTTFQNLILLILIIFFYLFIFIQSQYWQEHY